VQIFIEIENELIVYCSLNKIRKLLAVYSRVHSYFYLDHYSFFKSTIASLSFSRHFRQWNWFIY